MSLLSFLLLNSSHGLIGLGEDYREERLAVSEARNWRNHGYGHKTEASTPPEVLMKRLGTFADPPGPPGILDNLYALLKDEESRVKMKVAVKHVMSLQLAPADVDTARANERWEADKALGECIEAAVGAALGDIGEDVIDIKGTVHSIDKKLDAEREKARVERQTELSEKEEELASLKRIAGMKTQLAAKKTQLAAEEEKEIERQLLLIQKKQGAVGGENAADAGDTHQRGTSNPQTQ
jgi:hypothetical protein